jgi:hypothetical protein
MKRRTSRKLRSNSRRRSAITSKASKPKKIKFNWPPAIDYDTRVAYGLPVHGKKSRRTSRKLRSNSRRRTSIRRNSGSEPKIYCTSYCNFGHNMKTGRPIGHECRVIPPAALRAERAGDYGEAQRILSTGKRSSLRRNGSAYFFQGSPAVAEQKIHQIRAAGGSDLKATKRYDGIWTVTFNADAAAQNALFGGSASNPLRHRGSGYGIGTPMEMNSRLHANITTTAHNLSTYNEMEFSLPPREAVIAAYAHSRKDSNTWDYEKKYGRLVRKHGRTWNIGDWAAVEPLAKNSRRRTSRRR